MPRERRIQYEERANQGWYTSTVVNRGHQPRECRHSRRDYFAGAEQNAAAALGWLKRLSQAASIAHAEYWRDCRALDE